MLKTGGSEHQTLYSVTHSLWKDLGCEILRNTVFVSPILENLLRATLIFFTQYATEMWKTLITIWLKLKSLDDKGKVKGYAN